MICPECNKDHGIDIVICDICGYDVRNKIRHQRKKSSWHLADREERLFALLIDCFFCFIFGVVGMAAGILIGGGFNRPEEIMHTFVYLGALIYWIYQGVLLTKYGYTLGKKYMGIRISGGRTGWTGRFVSNVLLRLVLNTFLWLIPLYFIIDILFIFRRNKKCLHDYIARTDVVKI